MCFSIVIFVYQRVSIILGYITRFRQESWEYDRCTIGGYSGFMVYFIRTYCEFPAKHVWLPEGIPTLDGGSLCTTCIERMIYILLDSYTMLYFPTSAGFFASIVSMPLTHDLMKGTLE